MVIKLPPPKYLKVLRSLNHPSIWGGSLKGGSFAVPRMVGTSPAPPFSSDIPAHPYTLIPALQPLHPGGVQLGQRSSSAYERSYATILPQARPTVPCIFPV